ncbi:MAG: hypothetical protein MMC33_007838 [Icmadophila ericetorum]|nr:hypothetical protein [Icmadophila ericetorum]
MQDIRKTSSKTELFLEETAVKEHNIESQNVLDWISDFNAPQDQAEIHKDHVIGIGDWLLESDSILRWLEGAGSIRTIWCSRFKGSGKTVMSSVVINHLLEQAREDGVSVAFAYCKFNVKESREAEKVVGSLVKQLAQKDSQVLKQLSDEKHKGALRPNFHTLQNYLLQLCHNLGTIFVVVDAFDECLDPNERLKLLSILKQVE